MSDEINKDTVDYRDPTPFDDTKLNSISEISKGIRHKLYGKDTREAIAQQGEALVKLMQETGGNQAAEVIAARGKYEMLGIREDAQDNAIISAQSTADSKFSKADGESYLNSITVVPETFANLASIKAKYPSGKNGIMVAADNGHKYIWANSTWTDAGVYQSAGIADGSITTAKLKESSVTQDKLSFVPGNARKSTNLFNVDTVIVGKVIDTNPTLDLTDNADYVTSDWMYCNGASQVSIKACTFIQFASNAFEKISTVTNTGAGKITVDVPANSYYFRVSISTDFAFNKININLGNTLLEYETADNKTGIKQLDTDVINELDKIPDKPEQIVYGKPSANLFNKRSTDNKVGKAINLVTGGISSQEDYNLSHRINFTAGLDYTFDKVVFYAFYKNDGTYISGGVNPVTVTAPTAVNGYIMVSASNVYFNQIMVTQSSEKQAYESYNAKVTYNQLSNELKKTVTNHREISVTIEVSLDYDENTAGFGTTKFNSLIAAHNSITDSSVDKQYLILVHPGTYDDWAAKWPLNTTATGWLGIQPKPYVFFESTDIEHPENYVLRWDGAAELEDGKTLTSDQAMQRALFHLDQNPRTTQIKGFTFDVKNCRYCLHIESSGRGAGNELLISNCIFKWGGNPRVTGFDGAPLGMGISSGESVTIENCKWDVVESVPDATAGHNNGWGMDAVKFVRPPAILKMVNCDFNGKNFRMDTVSTADQKDVFDEIHLLNCRNINRAYNGLQGSATENNWRSDIKFSDIKTNELKTGM